MLENGQCYAGDLLVGADGIWSKVSFYLIFRCLVIMSILLLPMEFFITKLICMEIFLNLVKKLFS